MSTTTQRPPTVTGHTFTAAPPDVVNETRRQTAVSAMPLKRPAMVSAPQPLPFFCEQLSVQLEVQRCTSDNCALCMTIQQDHAQKNETTEIQRRNETLRSRWVFTGWLGFGASRGASSHAVTCGDDAHLPRLPLSSPPRIAGAAAHQSRALQHPHYLRRDSTAVVMGGCFHPASRLGLRHAE